MLGCCCVSLTLRSHSLSEAALLVGMLCTLRLMLRVVQRTLQTLLGRSCSISGCVQSCLPSYTAPHISCMAYLYSLLECTQYHH